MTAVFVSSDLMALGVLEGARERGLSVPEDLSVVGFDNIEMAAMSSPPPNHSRSTPPLRTRPNRSPNANLSVQRNNTAVSRSS